ncbi:MAG TPA: AAA family ATPase [Ktedonobacteraceae bacterium]|jgi:DNA-binding SARP family transcriptional activator
MNGNTITYRQQHSFCSKPGCRKCRDGIGHGPYWYAYQVVQGRTVRTYIGKTLPDGVQIGRTVRVPVSSPESPEPLTPAFRLITLGQLRLESHGEGESWQTVSEGGWRLPQARALLVCLVCTPDRQLSQQQACELLWPALDAKGAAQNLRRASTALAQLPGQVYSRRSGNLLIAASQARLWVDCAAFQALLFQARALPAAQRSERTTLLEQAITLYGGDFFPEERATPWAQMHRQTLHQQWIQATLALADLYLDGQRPSMAIDLLNRLIAAEPANEAAVQRLMFLLARQQRRVEAVQAYQRLATLLGTTHQAAPSPETRSLFYAIQQGREAFFRPLAAASDPAEISDAGQEVEMRAKHKNAGETPPVPTESGQLPAEQDASRKQGNGEVLIGRANQSPLVGRDPEVAALYHVLDRVAAMQGRQQPEESRGLLPGTPRTPRGQCAILMGELGIGKTRLAEEGAREARRRGWTVIWSQAYAQEQGIPYGLWIAALRNVLTHTPDLARQATEIAASALYQPLHVLVPEMQEALVRAGAKEVLAYDALLPEQEELRLREAVYTFLTSLSLTSPLLLVLDDIQWTDNSSAQMLGYLTRRMAEHPIVILATCRETELPANGVLNGLIAHMQREQVVEVLHVQPLSDEQIGALVSYLPAPAISHIQSQAGGNPFFAEELAYSLSTSSVLGEQSAPNAQAEEQILPRTIAAVLDRRLYRLSKECRDLVGKAAVLGGSFDLDLIAALAADGPVADHDTVLDLLDEALRSGILAEEGAGAHITFHFWHPLLASHLYNGLSAARRARLHRKIAGELQQLYLSRESEEAATIVRHLVLGGADPASIARFAELAAHRAYSLFAYAEAENYYRLALSHLAPDLMAGQETAPPEHGLLPGISPEQRLHLAFLCERLAECTRVRGNFKDAPLFYLRAIQLRTRPACTFATPAEERQQAQILAILWSEIAWIWRFTGDTAAARACNARGEEVLHTAGISDGPSWACLRHQQASLHWHEGYHQEALQASHQALNLFAACLTQAAPNEQPPVAANRQTRAMRTLLGDPVDLGRAHSSLGIIYTALGQLSEALKHSHEALTIYEQHNRRREAAHASCNIGHIHLMRAEYAQARPFLQRPLSYVEQSGDILKSVLLYNLGELAAADQRLDEAERFLRGALALVEAVHDREYLSNWNAILGAVFQAQGRFKEAAETILHALSIGRATPRNQPCIGFALIALANLRCALVEKEHSASSAKGRRILAHARTDLQRALGLRGLDAEKRTLARLAQAHVSHLLGQLPLARQQAQRARRDAQKYELRAIEQRCQRLLDVLPDA